jgi:hypothetical protein
MTGNQLASQLRTIKTKVHAFIGTKDDGFYAPIEKATLMRWLEGVGDGETGMQLRKAYGYMYFEQDYN